MTMAGRVGVSRPDPADPSPLRIDAGLVRTMLVSFLRDETLRTGLRPPLHINRPRSTACVVDCRSV